MPLEKAPLRERMLKQRAQIPPRERTEASARMQEHLLASSAWRQAKTPLLYCAVRGEAATDRLLKAALEEGKELLLPRCHPSRPGVMQAAPCRSPTDLRPGRFGIPEPPPANGKPSWPDLVLVPGCAFDWRGGRLGYGGGYYDRYLAACPARPVLVGFAFSCQIAAKVPLEPWDKTMDALCTENGFFRLQV